MSKIMEYLNKITSSVYGKDVRQAIHDAIHQCYADGKSGSIDLVARENIDLANKRIDNLAKLEDGSTTGDAELQDIRVGSDGTVHDSAGEAVRQQITQLNGDLADFKNGIININAQILKGYYINYIGTISKGNKQECVIFDISGLNKITLTISGGNNRRYGFTDLDIQSDLSLNGFVNNCDDANEIFDKNYKYLIVYATDDGETSPATVTCEYEQTHYLTKENEDIIYSNLGHKNLMGSEIGVLYPLNLKKHEALTISNKDGNNFTNLNIEFYDEAKTYIGYNGLGGLTSRTINPIGYDNISYAKFVSANGGEVEEQPAMVVKGTEAQPFVRYRDKSVNEEIDDILDYKESYNNHLDNAENLSLTWQDRIGDYFVAIVQSDTHFYGTDIQKRILELPKKINNEFPVDCIINLGDLIRGYEDYTLVEMKEQMRTAVKCYTNNCNIPVLITKGNHDDGSLYEWRNGEKNVNNTIAPSKMYSRIVKHNEKYNIVRNNDDLNSLYYYINFPSSKTRVYVLNCIDIPYENKEDNTFKAIGQWNYGYSQNQISWFANTLMELDSTWTTLVCSHISIDENLWTEELPVRNNDIVFNIINAFKHGNDYSATYNHNGETFSNTNGDVGDFYDGSINVSYNTAHDIICLSGHTHEYATSLKDDIRFIIFKTFVNNVECDIFEIDKSNKSVIINGYGYDKYRILTY